MKWKKPDIKFPIDGEIRRRKVFAWRRTPVGHYIVWLQFYYIEERYYQPRCGWSGRWSETVRYLSRY